MISHMPHGNSIFDNSIVRLVKLGKHEFAVLLAGVTNVRVNQLFLVTAVGYAKSFKYSACSCDVQYR